MTETEIKFKASNLDALRTLVLGAGGNRVSGFFEDNTVFDDQSGSLFSRKCILRLRKSDRITLAFKKPVEKAEFKVMEEYEVEVSDFDEMHAILCSLGYKKVFRYQKRREMFTLGGTTVCLDTTPIGGFVEIEGEKTDIEHTALLLKLDIKEGTSKNYLELYREFCSEKGSESKDMMFRGGETG